MPLILAILSFASCKTASKINTEEESKKKGALTEQQQIILENLFIEGCKARMAVKYEAAENFFRQCEKLDPQNIPVKYELSNVLKLTGRLEEATFLAKQCSEADPKNPWYHLAYIDCLHFKKQYAQAAEAYEKLVKNFPDRSEFLESMAIEYAMARNYNKSLKIYEEMEQRFGTNETFTLNKIKLLREQKKYSEAESELKKLIDSDPSEARYYGYLAEYYEEIKEFEKAKNIYEKMLVMDPNNGTVHLALANYYKHQGRMEDSQNELKIAFANPDLDLNMKLDILISYFRISEQYGEYVARGYELGNILLKVHPASPEVHGIYAEFLYRDRKYDEAQKHFRTAAFNDKSRFTYWRQLLDIESKLNQIDTLEKHSYMAMELFPNQPETYYINGYANLRLKNYKKAAESLNEGLEFIYEDKPLMLDFYANLGEAYNYLKEYEKSDKAFDNALKVDPDNASVLNNYAYYLSLRKEKLDKAESLSKRANELAPNKANYIDTYGWILYQQGKYKEAEEWLARASKLSPRSPSILEHYGDVLYKLNRHDEALNLWNQAKTYGGNSEALQKKINDKKLND